MPPRTGSRAVGWPLATMVFTVRVRSVGQGYSRRAVLAGAAGAAGLAVAGCGASSTTFGGTTATWYSGPDPLRPLLVGTMALAARYEATIAAVPALATRLTPLRDAHRAHVQALVREMGLVGKPLPRDVPSPSASATPSEPTTALAALATAEKAGQQAAAEACVSAPSYRALLLGTIAGCRASHVEALR
jgi:hypothetical protein